MVAAIAATLFLCSLLCLLSSLMMRWLRLRREARNLAVESQWRPICFSAMVGDVPDTLPDLPAADIWAFVEIWIDSAERIRGADAQQGLLNLGARLGLAARLKPWLTSRTTDNRLLALLALGLLRDKSALSVVRASLDDDYPLISLAAAKALMEIDPVEGLPELLRRLDRPGWPQGRVRQLLALAPRDLLMQTVQLAIEEFDASAIPSLLRTLHALSSQHFDAAARLTRLRFPHDERILETLLDLTSNPAELALARQSCRHGNPQVRRAALTALSRLGDATDDELIRERLEQDTWHNQQLAARVLISSVGMTAAKAAATISSLRSEQARLHWLEAIHRKGWAAAEAGAHA